MPVSTAQRALRHGVAVSVADPRRAQLRGARGGDFNPSALMLSISTPSRSPRACRTLVLLMTRFWPQPISSRLIAVPPAR